MVFFKIELFKVRSDHYILWMMGFLLLISCSSNKMISLPLADLSAFEKQDGNWIIVGDVDVDTSINAFPDHSDTLAQREAENAVDFIEGTGVLLNINSKDKMSQLVANWSHGDIQLTTEFIMPKGSNSGIYLQGRYEVQLLDSWGVSDPRFLDLGGIYENWEKDPARAFKGSAPMVNASLRPGEWQTIEILFRAPRFNDVGEKLSNARFEWVKLNGQLIQQDVELSWTTAGPIENNEVSMGPLMIQGNHGPVAFKNIQYHLLSE